MSVMFRLPPETVHDRLRFVATIVGIVSSSFFVTVQMGLYVASGAWDTMIDHAPPISGHAAQHQVFEILLDG